MGDFANDIENVLRENGCRPTRIEFDPDRELYRVGFLDRNGDLHREQIMMRQFSASRVYSMKSTSEIICEILFGNQ